MISIVKKIFTKNSSDKEKDALSEEKYFEEMYLNTKDYVRNLVYWHTNNSVVDELVQDVFMKAWKGLPHFKKEANPKTWIYKITMNVVYDYYRSKTNEAVKDSFVAESCDKASNDSELRDLIEKALSSLNIEQREVFVLYYKMEYSLEEISKLLNIPLGTVKSRIHYAKDKFQSFFEKEEVDVGKV